MNTKSVGRISLDPVVLQHRRVEASSLVAVLDFLSHKLGQNFFVKAQLLVAPNRHHPLNNVDGHLFGEQLAPLDVSL
jgi:hypothetical protein